MWTDGPHCCRCCCCFNSRLIFDPWTCMNGYRHGNIDTWPALCPSDVVLYLCAALKMTQTFDKNKRLDHTSVCVSLLTHSPLESTVLLLLVYAPLVFVQVLWMLRRPVFPTCKNLWLKPGVYHLHILTQVYTRTHKHKQTNIGYLHNHTLHNARIYLFICVH